MNKYKHKAFSALGTSVHTKNVFINGFAVKHTVLLIIILSVATVECIAQSYGFEYTIGHSEECVRTVYVRPRILSLDAADDSLKIDFSIFDRDTGQQFRITGFKVTKGFNPKKLDAGDSSVFLVENDSGIDSISFPHIPTNFIEIKKKRDRPKATSLTKKSDYEFQFKTPSSCLGGHWTYDSRFGDQSSRWLFTKDGYFDPFMDIQYMHWQGGDWLKIFLKERRSIDKESFKVLDSKGNEVPSSFVIGRNPTCTIALDLVQELKSYEKFEVLISNTIINGSEKHETYYRYPLKVGWLSGRMFGVRHMGLEK
jgi:hypothetical protein